MLRDLKEFQIVIPSARGGRSRSYTEGRRDQFSQTYGLDIDGAIGGNLPKKISGALVPVKYQKFSGSSITSLPKWIIKTPKGNGGSTVFNYVYHGAKLDAFTATSAGNGAMKTTDNASAPNSFPLTVTSGAGNGGAYYNNYVYCFTPTDVSRYGPLDTPGSLAMTNGVWTGATLGSQTALTDTTYPINLPNHPCHVHIDNKLYFGDFKNGRGMIHFIKTTKTTAEGDTNDGSTYATGGGSGLLLPFGFMPTDIESYGNDLAIIAIQTSDSNVHQGNAYLFIWDTFSDSFYAQIPLPDPLATAILNANGKLYVWTGFNGGGFKVLKYLGGYSFEPMAFHEEGNPPLPGAVAAGGDKLYFPGTITTPATRACLFSLGYKDENYKALHNIAIATDTASTIYSIAQVMQTQQFEVPKLILGWHETGSTAGLDEYASGNGSDAVYRSNLFMLPKPFRINLIRIPLALSTGGLTTNQTITPVLYFDNFDSARTKTLNTINSTNYPSQKNVVLIPNSGATGEQNFMLELTWSGSTGVPLYFPIIIEGEYLDASK